MDEEIEPMKVLPASKQTSSGTVPGGVTGLNELVNKCIASPGYVIIVGTLGPEDPNGDRMINFEYQRYHFPLEDVKTVIKSFKDHFRNDVLGDGL